jgi:glycerophosphoryl diester phosphodiesterase
MRHLLALALSLMTTAAAFAAPVVIGHRGAAGERPEHTLESYRVAIAAGADFIEPDLVSTKDGILVARHENEIGSTTDIAAHPEFAARHTTKTIDGTPVTGWFTEDFTLAELKTLRARERLPALRVANAAWDGEFDVPTFAEILALVRDSTAKSGRAVGVYPETKHPGYFAAIGLPLERRLVDALDTAGYRDATDAAIIQSFEVGNLKALRTMTGLRLIQLIDAGHPADDSTKSYDSMITPGGLRHISTYANGIGPAKTRIVPRDAAGRSLAPTSLVVDAHAAGLVVHPWTFRAENAFLPLELRHGDDPAARGDAVAEIAQFFALGVDGVFADSPAIAVAARAGVML